MNRYRSSYNWVIIHGRAYVLTKQKNAYAMLPYPKPSHTVTFTHPVFKDNTLCVCVNVRSYVVINQDVSVREVPTPPQDTCVMSPNGKLIAIVVKQPHEIQVRDSTTQRVVHRYQFPNLPHRAELRHRQLSFSTDGQRLHVLIGSHYYCPAFGVSAVASKHLIWIITLGV